MSEITELRDPRALAARYLTHHRLWGHPDEADILSDALLGVAIAVGDWDEDRDGALITFCWFKMRSAVGNGRRRRARYQKREARLDLASDGEWLRCRTADDAFRQVEDRVYLQHLADMAHLTDRQADSVAWMAAHGWDYGAGGVRGAGGNTSHWTAGVAKLRHVATTGRAWMYGAGYDGHAARRHLATDTHCAQGHEWTEATIYIRPSNGYRMCRTCINNDARARRAREAAA
jgi:hypothetical protein